MRNTHTATRGERVTAKQGQETQGNDTVETRCSGGVRDLMVREQRDDTCEKGERELISVAATVGSGSHLVSGHTHTHTHGRSFLIVPASSSFLLFQTKQLLI